MTRALRFSRSELANAALIAREHGVSVKLDRDGSILVFPGTHRPDVVDAGNNDDLDAELAAFEARHGGR